MDGEIHQQNGVFERDAGQQQHGDHRHARERQPEQVQRHDRPNPGRGNGGKNGQRMPHAFIEHAQGDPDGQDGRDDQDLAVMRAFANVPLIALQLAGDGFRQMQASPFLIDDCLRL